MYYIKRNGEPVATSDPNEVTKENFLVEPGGENLVWLKIEQYEYDRQGNKVTLCNQVNAVVPGDFEKFASEWKRQGKTLTMLHDPRPTMKGEGVEDKLAKLREQMAVDAAPEGAAAEQPADAAPEGAAAKQPKKNSK